MPQQVLFITAIILFADIFPLPPDFHTILTIAAGGTFAWGCYVNILKKMPLYALLYALFAIVYNPVKEIELSRLVWIAADIIGATLLIATKDRFER